MFRNTYDGDNTTFSPQGRLHQVEYAMEAVKQGSAAVGLRSKKHVVLLTLKRSTGELASYQKKLIRIDDHMGVAIAGLTSDARVLSDFMRQQAMSSKMIYARPIPIGRAVNAISDKAQYNTQMYGRRPYGVGFLVAGYDESGPHLYEFAPSGVTYEYYAMAIGARSQSAKTYLETHYESFPDCTLDELIMHGLNALRDTLQQDKDLSTLNTSIATVGPASISALLSQSLVAQNPPKASLSSTTSTTASGTNVTELFTPITSLQQTAGPTEDFIKDKFTVIEGEDLKSYLDRMEKREEPGAVGESEEGDMQADAPADGAAPAAGGDGAQGSAGTGNMQTD